MELVMVGVRVDGEVEAGVEAVADLRGAVG